MANPSHILYGFGKYIKLVLFNVCSFFLSSNIIHLDVKQAVFSQRHLDSILKDLSSDQKLELIETLLQKKTASKLDDINTRGTDDVSDPDAFSMDEKENKGVETTGYDVDAPPSEDDDVEGNTEDLAKIVLGTEDNNNQRAVKSNTESNDYGMSV